MKISAERLKKIIKEEVQHVRTMPVREALPEPSSQMRAGAEPSPEGIESLIVIVRRAAFEINGAVNPDDPTDQVGEKYSEQLDWVVGELEKIKKALEGQQ